MLNFLETEPYKFRGALINQEAAGIIKIIAFTYCMQLNVCLELYDFSNLKNLISPLRNLIYFHAICFWLRTRSFKSFRTHLIICIHFNTMDCTFLRCSLKSPNILHGFEVCVCEKIVCVSVCVWVRDGEREREKEKERDNVCECVANVSAHPMLFKFNKITQFVYNQFLEVLSYTNRLNFSDFWNNYKLFFILVRFTLY